MEMYMHTQRNAHMDTHMYTPHTYTHSCTLIIREQPVKAIMDTRQTPWGHVTVRSQEYLCVTLIEPDFGGTVALAL